MRNKKSVFALHRGKKQVPWIDGTITSFPVRRTPVGVRLWVCGLNTITQSQPHAYERADP